MNAFFRIKNVPINQELTIKKYLFRSVGIIFLSVLLFYAIEQVTGQITDEVGFIDFIAEFGFYFGFPLSININLSNH